ncbi:MAG: flagellar biosynthetic protein FliO [Clostridiales bacterium]|nr:flagellar biosynthetic protein FliO [Clostridiales bacterium]
MNNFFSSIFLPFFGVVFIILLAYWFTKWLSKNVQGMTSGTYIKILERVIVGQDKTLALVKVSNTVYLLGITGNSMQTICTFDASEIKTEENVVPNTDFGQIISKYINVQLPFIKGLGCGRKTRTTSPDGDKIETRYEFRQVFENLLKKQPDPEKFIEKIDEGSEKA